ncbi:nuclease-related domain-containing protein [Selenomonas ruminantium]|uniref:nuclease-related domain-containing protein n=1 Tax=Selenomonas ruminantium TaxID=971 RepID=UPI0026EEC3E7|nr:nuclease-related domain-containing protein [Selenomonas ruminantium]
MANIHNSKVHLGITWKDIYLFLCIFSYMTSAYGFIHFLSFIVDMSNGIRPNFSDMLIYMFMFGIGGQLGKFFWQRREIYASGARGETMVVSSLSNMLPDRYSIYRNVRVHEKMECDFVIVGENGVFLVECKNYNGTLVGDMDDNEWTLEKVGQKGGEYSKKIRNPVKQLKRNVSILSRYFKMEGCSAWIEGYVCFPSTKTISLISSPMIGDTKYIASLIVNYVPKHHLSPRKIEAIKDSLEKCILEHPAMTKNEFEEHRAV